MILKEQRIIFNILCNFIPLFNGTIGVIIASTPLNLSLGGSMLFGLIIASASYIAVPVVLRLVLPKANPSLYITGALGITFPFNVIANLPILYTVSTILNGLGIL